MNRFATFAVLALAAFALSAINGAPTVDESLDEETLTQFSLQVSDEEETRAVEQAKLGIFNDFCLSTRDYVLGDIKTKTGQMSSQGFSSFFQMAEEVARQALDANQDAVTRLSKQLADPSAPVEGDDATADAQREIAEQSQPRGFITAIKTTMVATMEAVRVVVSRKFESLKSALNIKEWIALAEGGCAQAAVYEDELLKRFETYKQGFAGTKYEESFGKLTMDAIPCVTSSRIVRVNGICGFVKVSVEPTKKMLANYVNQKAVKDAVAEH